MASWGLRPRLVTAVMKGSAPGCAAPKFHCSRNALLRRLMPPQGRTWRREPLPSVKPGRPTTPRLKQDKGAPGRSVARPCSAARAGTGFRRAAPARRRDQASRLEPTLRVVASGLVRGPAAPEQCFRLEGSCLRVGASPRSSNGKCGWIRTSKPPLDGRCDSLVRTHRS